MVLSHTIGHNIFNSGIDGFSFSVDHETVKVLPNVFITTDSGDGIQSDYPNSVLINSGSIIAGLEVGGSFGVFFTNTSNDSKIRNSIGASIIGRDGVDMYGSGSQIFHNFGSIVVLQKDKRKNRFNKTLYFGAGKLIRGFTNFYAYFPI